MRVPALRRPVAAHAPPATRTSPSSRSALPASPSLLPSPWGLPLAWIDLRKYKGGHTPLRCVGGAIGASERVLTVALLPKALIGAVSPTSFFVVEVCVWIEFVPSISVCTTSDPIPLIVNVEGLSEGVRNGIGEGDVSATRLEVGTFKCVWYIGVHGRAKCWSDRGIDCGRDRKKRKILVTSSQNTRCDLYPLS